MALTSGTKFGPYEIVSPLGSGGMGEVYRARDSRLDRTVAIKVLPSHLTGDSEAQERFDREARSISSLSHPNVCQLYDVGSQDGTSYLVMEFLEGETLADRLLKGPLTLPQFFKISIEICEGLEKAHRNGIVHRDLKPSNIMLTKSGAKLMDFGLAKPTLQVATSVAGLSVTISTPAGSQPLTAQGTVLGTFQFMSPEQAEGREADARSDIFSLGTVLYEMLTGKRAFEGKTAASVMAAVLERDPAPVSSIQPAIPATLDRIVKTCLAKDPDDRFQTVHDLKMQLKWGAENADSTSSAALQPSDAREKGIRGKTAWIVAGALALSLLSLAAWLMLRRSQGAEATPVFAFIPPPPDTRYLAFGFGAGPVAVSPDGIRVAFSAIDQSGAVKLWIRSLSAREGVAVNGTDNASAPFWSPDGRTVGFFADAKLKTLDVDGGTIQVLSEVPPLSGSASWGTDGTILFSSRGGGLSYLSTQDGKVGHLNPPGANDFDQDHPAFLPDGKHFLYEVESRSNQVRIEMGSLGSSASKLVLENAHSPGYAAGFLLFVREGKVFAQRFDVGAGKVSGGPTMLADSRSYSVGGRSALAFQATSSEARLQWYDREGKPLGTIGPVTAYLNVKLSPDGKQVLTVQESQQDRASSFWGSNLWSIPADGGVSSRLTYGKDWKGWSVWSPDGKYIAHSVLSDGKAALVRRPADGSGSEETLLTLGSDFPIASVVDWSPDGRYLSYYAFDAKKAQGENWIVPLFGDRKPFQVAPVAAAQYDGNFSPDGHWLAYFSYESGRPEVYVVPFPGPGGKYQISRAGGWNLRWGGKNQLYFLTTGNEIVEADLNLTKDALQVKVLRPLFQMNLLDEAAPLFDVSADGQRFLMVTPARAESTSIGLLLNWSTLAAAKK
jgi:serine/threonine protein kinase/Tol biopolymer transport system component